MMGTSTAAAEVIHVSTLAIHHTGEEYPIPASRSTGAEPTSCTIEIQNSWSAPIRPADPRSVKHSQTRPLRIVRAAIVYPIKVMNGGQSPQISSVAAGAYVHETQLSEIVGVCDGESHFHAGPHMVLRQFQIPRLLVKIAGTFLNLWSVVCQASLFPIRSFFFLHCVVLVWSSCIRFLKLTSARPSFSSLATRR